MSTTLVLDATRKTVPGPIEGMRITEAYARTVARDAYFWAWPMVNMYNRRLMFQQAPEPAHLDGIMPLAPLNRLSMLTDYVEPSEREVACPNQDVVYGAGIVALDLSPVVIQVPEFGDRFWVYQVVDLRTDSFAEFGAMYETRPGFYLLVGPSWTGEVPKGIAKVFRAPTNTGMVGPRVAQDDARGQGGGSGGHPRHRHVSARGVRRQDEAPRLAYGAEHPQVGWLGWPGRSPLGVS